MYACPEKWPGCPAAPGPAGASAVADGSTSNPVGRSTSAVAQSSPMRGAVVGLDVGTTDGTLHPAVTVTANDAAARKSHRLRGAMRNPNHSSPPSG